MILSVIQVVLYFRQSVATPAGQTLTVNMPEGFRVPWEDSDDCLSPSPVTGVAPVDLHTPFGAGAVPDPDLFTTIPQGTAVSCAASPDGGSAYLTLSLGFVEINRYYAFRLSVQNAERSGRAVTFLN